MLTKVVVASLFVVLPGCSALNGNASADAGPPPVLGTVNMESTAAVGADGNYDLSGTVSYTDGATNVSTVHFVCPAFSVDEQIAIPSAASATDQAFTATIPVGTIPVGTQAQYTISVINDNGAESPTVTEMVTLD